MTRDVRLDRLIVTGNRLRAARDGEKAAFRAAERETLRAHEAGVSEVAIARALGVDRGTVRKWLGKGA
jgi:DNA-binding CsgD family transcriptional regulator